VEHVQRLDDLRARLPGVPADSSLESQQLPRWPLQRSLELPPVPVLGTDTRGR
jgi:hypothetical protein